MSQPKEEHKSIIVRPCSEHHPLRQATPLTPLTYKRCRAKPELAKVSVLETHRGLQNWSEISSNFRIAT